MLTTPLARPSVTGSYPLAESFIGYINLNFAHLGFSIGEYGCSHQHGSCMSLPMLASTLLGHRSGA